MGALSIVTINPSLLSLKHIVLRQRADEVPIHDAKFLEMCRTLAPEMFEVMYAHDGAGLAAPQVGDPESGSFPISLPPHAHPGRISGPHKKGEGRAPARTVRGRGSGPAECETRTDKSLSHASPPRRDPRRDRWAPVDSTGTRPPSSPTPRIGTSPSGWSRPHSVTQFQSTFSPLSVHMWVHIQSTWGSTYVVHVRVPHARGHGGIYGVQRRMVETM
jgi:hypothetical protein